MQYRQIPTRLLIGLLALAAGACQNSALSSDRTPDASAAAPRQDDGAVLPDTTRIEPDTATIELDAARIEPDTARIEPDAAPVIPRDAAMDVPVQPDTAVQPMIPVISVAPAAVVFDATVVGEISAARVVMVTVTGGSAVVFPFVTGDFMIDASTCGAASTSCTIVLKFSPGSVGPRSGVLTINSQISVPLSGQGILPGTFRVVASLIPDTVLVNASQPISVTVTATTAMSDFACLTSGANLTVDPAKTTCTGMVAANTPCVYAFIFNSATVGAKSEAITCSSKGVVQIVSVTLTVVAPASLLVSPSKGAFSTMVGTTSAPITFNFANPGGTTTGNLMAALVGANASDFQIQDNKCVVPLASLATCSVQVVFKPAGTAIGNRVATLTLTDTTAGSVPVSAALTGVVIEGRNPSIAGPLTFAPVMVGQASPPSTYTIANSGGAATGELGVFTDDPQFAKGNDLCSGVSLDPGQTCTFTITFAPTKPGAAASVLKVLSAGVVLATLQITGTGSPVSSLALTMTPVTLDFGTTVLSEPVGPMTFTVTNTGTTATGALSVVKSDSPASTGGASQFTFTTTCSAPLAPSATCQVAVTFDPTMANKNMSAIIKVADGTVSAPTGTVVGTGLRLIE
jgi:hypothetical protein